MAHIIPTEEIIWSSVCVCVISNLLAVYIQKLLFDKNINNINLFVVYTLKKNKAIFFFFPVLVFLQFLFKTLNLLCGSLMYTVCHIFAFLCHVELCFLIYHHIEVWFLFNRWFSSCVAQATTQRPFHALSLPPEGVWFLAAWSRSGYCTGKDQWAGGKDQTQNGGPNFAD